MKFFSALFISLFLCGCNSAPSKFNQVSEHEKKIDRVTVLTAQKVEKEKHLRLIGTGGGGADGKIRKLNMAFDCLGEVSIDEARQLLIYCVDEYLSAINAHEEFRPYLTHFPFTPKDVEIKIFINNRNYQEVPFECLAVVREEGGVLTYKIRQQNEHFNKTILEETYEEARNKIIENTALLHSK